MKLSLLLLLGLSVSLSTSAQIITGGAMVGPQIAITKGFENLKSFENHLVKKHKWCPAAGIKLKDPDLMDAYLKFVLLRSTHKDGDDCDKANAYFKCMNDETTVSLLENLKKNKVAILLIKTKYNISRKKVNEIFDFFSKLDKKIE